MANQTILLIDPDTRNLSVMEVQLRKHRYNVQTASEISQALQLIRVTPPDLIICEADVKGESGIELCKRLKGEVATSETPFIILSADLSLKVNALETGADDFLAKPVYVGELKDRLEVVLQKRKRLGLEKGQSSRFFGRLEEMDLLYLLQIIDVSRRSGSLKIEHKNQNGALWFEEGELLDAEMGHLKGVDAIYRLLTWSFGQYEFDFNKPTRSRQINNSIAEIKAEGVQRVTQWNSMCEQLPALETILRVDRSALTEREDRGEPLNHEMTQVLSVFDGYKTMQEVIDTSRLPDLDILKHLTLLYFVPHTIATRPP